MYRRVMMVWSCLAFLAGHGFAGEAGKEDQPLKLAVDLEDGSHLIGVPAATSLSIRTPFADMAIPFKRIQAISLGAKDGNAILTLQNGDVLTGSPDARSLNVTTLFGAVEVPLSMVKGLSVVSGEAGAGLLLYYTFDQDRDGKVMDQSGHGFNGTVAGNVLYEPSFKGKAARFTAPNSYIVCEARELNMAGWRQATVCAWVQFRQFTTYGCVMSRGSVTDEQNGGLSFFAGGVYGGKWQHTLLRLMDKGNAVDANGTRFQSAQPELGKWYHMAGTYDGRKLTLYIDGEPDAGVETPKGMEGITDSPATRLVIGTDGMRSRITSWTDVFLNGLVDEVRVYNRCLGAEEIRRLFRAGGANAEKPK